MTTTLASDADILNRIEGFCKRHEIPPTTFGRKAIGDANLIDNLRAGRELRRATEARIRNFMAGYTSVPAPVLAASTCCLCQRTSNDTATLTCRHINCPIQEEREERDLIARGVLTKAAA